MKIYRETLNEILKEMPLVPPEAGGILGGKEGRVYLWKPDKGYPESGCVYRPNVDFLNGVIARWMDEGYDFMGILHVHFGGARLLSDGDTRYIEKIMEAMPKSVKRLYFPIGVQPGKQFVSYMAYRDLRGKTVVTTDETEVFC